VKANNTRINGFNISGSTASGYAGIFLYYSNNCTIENNKLLNNVCGIYLWFANRNNVLRNTATNNGAYGGILLQGSTFNTVSENKVYNNQRGIYLGTSSDNTLSSNTVQHSTGDWGFFVCGKSPKSLIYNNYFNETNLTIKNTHDSVYVNTLNIKKTAGTNIVGGPFIGGNYWAKPDGTGFSQTAVDKDGDGISDSVYNNVSGSIYSDYLPLVIYSKPPAPTLPVANFNSNVTSGNTPLTVLFNSTSTNAANVSWNFGDGTTAVTGTPVSHTFTNKGTSTSIPNYVTN
jgi:parallel beta-helix repeat protein